MPFEKYSGSEGVEPPNEAYSRVTNPERFRPLHQAVLEMLDALEARFDVERVEGHGLDEELESRSRDPAARPGIALKPIGPEAAPVTVIFTEFPGLAIRFGRWYTDFFPGCGCDACDESAKGESERLTELMDSVTSGGFREAEFYSQPVLPFDLGRKARIAYAAIKPGDKIIEGDPPFRTGGTHRTAEFRGPSLRMRSGESIDGGHPSLLLDWKPWPLRPVKPETGD